MRDGMIVHECNLEEERRSNKCFVELEVSGNDANLRGALPSVGADGVMVEVHPDPDSALSDAEQQLTLDGVTYIRSMVDQANAVKVMYTRLGDNMLSNGGAESGAWTVAAGKGGITGAAVAGLVVAVGAMGANANANANGNANGSAGQSVPNLHSNARSRTAAST